MKNYEELENYRDELQKEVQEKTYELEDLKERFENAKQKIEKASPDANTKLIEYSNLKFIISVRERELKSLIVALNAVNDRLSKAQKPAQPGEE